MLWDFKVCPHTFISTCSSISFVLIVVYSFSNLKKKKHRASVKTNQAQND